jgi:PST family polysaccharide transporter
MSWRVFGVVPDSLRQSIEQRPRLAAALANIAWIFGDNIMRTFFRLVLGVWVARYLGPELFGLLSYAVAFVSVFSTIAALGLNVVVVRDLVMDPSAEGAILGSACLLRFIAGVVALALSTGTIYVARPDEPALAAMVAILGSTMVIGATDVIKYWFDSKVAYKYVVWAENAGFFAASLIKIALILLNAPVMSFVWASFAEAAFSAVALVTTYIWSKGTPWRANIGRAYILLRESWPLLVAGLSIMVYSRIDQIILGQFRGDAEVGMYAAAVRVAEFWLFVPGAIVGSVFPSIIAAREQAGGVYETRLQYLFDAMAAIGIAVAILFTLLATPLMTLVFGTPFRQAGPVLAIYGWAGLFVGLDAASSRYMLLEGLQRVLMYRHALGAALNILLNWLMIPVYGMIGSAIASILSFVIANYVLDLSNAKTRRLFLQKSRALILLWALKRVPEFKRSRTT